MMRPLTVALGFVVVNAICFVAYRASAASSSSSKTRLESTPTLDTFSHGETAVHRKPGAAAVLETPSTTQKTTESHAESITPKSIATEPTESDADDSKEAEGPRPRPRPRPAAIRRAAEPPPPAKPAPVQAAPVEKEPAEREKPRAKDRLLEMEANPYKRGE